MKRDTRLLLRRWPVLRRAGGGCLLFLYLLAGIPLAPALTTLLAMADSSHHVAVQATPGGIQVVLRHECVNSPAHHHGCIARTLTLIAQRPVEGLPDHVIQFAASAVSQRASAPAIAPSLESSATKHLPPSEPCPCPSALTSVTAVHPRPPPDTSELLLTLRSTVLLI